MKLQGKLHPPQIQWQAPDRLLLIAEVGKEYAEGYEELKDSEIDIEVKKHRKKRSLDANAYYWVLIGKLARRVCASLPEVHNRMLQLYGQIEEIEGEAVCVVIPDTEEAERKIRQSDVYHLKPTTAIRPGEEHDYRVWLQMRGSSTYTTDEMAQLISGLISECKEVGISDAEIATPEERRILKERYGVEL